MTGAELLGRQQRLRAHVALVEDKPCQWGRDDCSAWAGTWVERERGVLIALPSYDSEAQARDMIEKAGGLVNLWSRVLMLAGVPETDMPQYGDVGLVETRLGPVGVIVTHDGICAWRATHGLTFIRPRTFLKVWAV